VPFAAFPCGSFKPDRHEAERRHREDYFVFVGVGKTLVIPGRAQREPGIQKLSREIPGSSLRDAPE
jgi:hypothetical protein